MVLDIIANFTHGRKDKEGVKFDGVMNKIVVSSLAITIALGSVAAPITTYAAEAVPNSAYTQTIKQADYSSLESQIKLIETLKKMGAVSDSQLSTLAKTIRSLEISYNTDNTKLLDLLERASNVVNDLNTQSAVEVKEAIEAVKNKIVILETVDSYEVEQSKANISFPDVQQGSWYYSDVMNLVNMGAINGYPDGRFGPSNDISYAEYLTILVKTTKAGDGNYTSPEGANWYFGVEKAAYDSDILMQGEIKDFNAPITRADAAKFTGRALSYVLNEDYEPLKGVDKLMKDFNEVKVLDQAVEIVQLYSMGVIVGDDNGNFRPHANLSRAEAATIILRTVKTENRKDVSNIQIPEEEVSTTDSITYTDGRYTGMMRLEHADKYAREAFSTARFYKENGEYYASITVPKLPDGFVWRVSVDSWLANGDIYFGSGSDPKYGMVKGLTVNGNTYTFRFYDHFEEGIGPEQIDTAVMSIAIANKSLQDAGEYGNMVNHRISNKSPNKILETQPGNGIEEWRDFDTTGIFNW